MAVDLIQLAAALRLGDGETAPTEPVAGILNRLLDVSTATVESRVPSSPQSIKDEATVRLAAYLYDAPTASSGDRYAAAWRNSGAESLTSRFEVRRAAGETPAPVVPGVPSVGGLDADAVKILIAAALAELDVPSAAADAVAALDLPGQIQTALDALDVPGQVGTAIDNADVPGQIQTAISALDVPGQIQTALDALDVNGRIMAAITALDIPGAIEAAILAHAGLPNIHHTPTPPGGAGGAGSLNLPGPAVAMRLGWSQTQDAVAGIFTRAEDHPEDGAAEGLTSGVEVPPFPPSLNTDASLFQWVWVAGSPTIDDGIDLYTSQGALIVDAVEGTAYVSNARLFPPIPSQPSTIIVSILGELIASQPWVTEQLEAGTTTIFEYRKGTVLELSPVAAGGGIDGPHGLNAMPTLVDLYLECLITQHGYAVGDQLRTQWYNATTYADPLSCGLRVRNQSTVQVAHKDTGVRGAITPENWKFVVVPYLGRSGP